MENTIDRILRHEIFHIKDYKFTGTELLEVLFWLLLMVFLIRVVKKSIYKSSTLDTGKKYTISQLTKYIFIFIFTTVILKTLGINMTAVLAGSTALLVGVGIGLQKLVLDFLSGIVLLFEGSIEVGDIIKIKGHIVKVIKIKMRTTVVETINSTNIILPNSELTGNDLINYTHKVKYARFHVDIGVAYSTDVNKVTKLLEECAYKHQDVLKDPNPFVRLVDMGNYSLKFRLLFFTYNVFRIREVKSELRLLILNSMTENNISMPYPEQTIHIADDSIIKMLNNNEDPIKNADNTITVNPQANKDPQSLAHPTTITKEEDLQTGTVENKNTESLK